MRCLLPAILWGVLLTAGACSGEGQSSDVGPDSGFVQDVGWADDGAGPDLTWGEDGGEGEVSDLAEDLVGCADGEPCDDGNPCTTDDSCLSGECAGTALHCDDGLECTTDSCVDGECLHSVADGSCVVSGECLLDGEPLVANPCLGCVVAESNDSWTYLNDWPCNDGDACTHEDSCQAGACLGEQLSCDDGLDCTQDSCVAGECTVELAAGACLIDGVCHLAGAQPEADEEGHWECRVCSPEEDPAAWAAVSGPCGKENSCLDNRACVEGLCVEKETPYCPTDFDPPCQFTVCDEALDACAQIPVEAGTACDDGNGCTAGDSCFDGACVAGALTCDCFVDSDCASFEDGDLCNGTLVCAPDNTCMLDPDTVVQCDPGLGSDCLANECNGDTGECALVPVADGAGCDDGELCTSGDSCLGGECVGVPISCDDGNVCTDDLCDDFTGCKHLVNIQPCEDGNPCTDNDVCKVGKCQGGSPTECDNGNECTEDGCDPVLGCTHFPLEGPCNDGNACTKSDKCVAGVCTGSALYCDDGEACTLDSCDPDKGCVFQPTEDCGDVTVAPAFTLTDYNPISPTFQQEVSPVAEYEGLVYMFMLHDPG